MKWTLQLLLHVLILCSLASCGGSGDDASPDVETRVIDSDGDGVNDDNDAFPNDANETQDTDGDGVGDNGDAFPNDESETQDTDGDGVGDNGDAFPNDESETQDTDGDGVGDNGDAFPNDETESQDTDGDGVGDNADVFVNDASETLDSDGDGVGDNSDPDLDGDGVANEQDSFPNDSSEASDTDGDGIGDNTDPDIDGDGIANEEDDTPYAGLDSDNDGVFDNNDFYPNDAGCHAEQDGDGTECYLTLLKQDSSDVVSTTHDDLVYFFLQSQSKLLTYDLAQGAFINATDIEVESNVTSMLYHSAQQRFYFMLENNSIYFYELNGTASLFTDQVSSPQSIVQMGNFVGFESYSRLYIYDLNGTLVSTAYMPNNILDAKWNSNTEQLVYVSGYEEVRYAGVVAIDSNTGEVTFQDYGYVYSLGAQEQSSLRAPFTILSGGEHILLASGEVVSLDGFLVQSQLDIDFSNVYQLTDGGIITLNYSAGNTNLHWYDDSLRLLDSQTYQGGPIEFYPIDGSGTLFTNTIATLKSYEYDLNTDNDGDSVENALDMFPMDIAASADSDGDGYPDSWNDGYSETDSTTGLTIDAFPDDFSCWLTEHDDGSGSCDYSLTIPEFEPASVFVGDGKVFLHHKNNGVVYRWDVESGVYLQPIVVRKESQFGFMTAEVVTYSPEHQRMYVGYIDGTIYYIADGDEQSSRFAELDNPVVQIAPQGAFLFVLNGDDEYNSESSVLDVNGGVVDTESTNGSYDSYIWNEQLDVAYFFSDNWQGFLFYQALDQQSGEIGDRNYVSLRNSIGAKPKVALSPDGASIALSNGSIFATATMQWLGSLDSFADVLWLDNGELLSVAATSDDSYTLVRRTTDYRVAEVAEINFEFLNLVAINERVFILGRDSGTFIFHEFIANDDSDGDGITNLSDAFPMDIAASIDSDNDGYPDSWNDGYGESDSTTALSLDVYPSDSACWLEEHDDGEGNCDFGATIPEFTPDAVASDANGIVYLYRQTHRTVYRWSSLEGAYLNPIHVGSSDGLSSDAPAYMAYSAAHERLYFAYSDSVVTYVSTSGAFEEVSFARTTDTIGGVAAVGDYVLVQDDSGAWESHHIYDADGNLTDSREWNTYSRQYAWNEALDRVYFFRDGTSPNDLMYEDINQSTGEISASGESPYHGDYYIRLPIRVSNDGALVLLGSGDLYDADTITWQGSVGEFDDGLWLDSGELVTIVNTDNNQFVLTRLSGSYQRLEVVQYDGQLLRIIQAGGNTYLLSQNDSELFFTLYTPDDDVDSDGVENVSDAFPMDVAASLDSDNDGYPDSWNDGYTEADSSMNLTLDEFPVDSACWLAEHDDGEGNCDFSATMPVFSANQILSDGNGTVFLFSASNGAVYRWSADSENYINPIYIGQDNGLEITVPHIMTYSSAHERLYFGYSTGEITYVDLNNIGAEQRLLSLAMRVNALASAGDYLLAQDSSGAWGSHYVINSEGTITDSKEWQYASNSYLWNDSNSRVFLSGPEYKEIDQTSGEITADSSGHSYHGSSSNGVLLASVVEGQFIVTDNGSVFSTDTLELEHSLRDTFVGVVDFDDVLVAAVVNSDDSSALNIYNNDDFGLEDSIAVGNQILTIHKYNNTLLSVSMTNNEYVYTMHEFGDADADMMPTWWENKHQLDDNNAEDSALDADDDGLTNLEEYLAGTSASESDTDGDGIDDFEEINTHGTEPTIADTDYDGLNDGDEVNTYATNPLDSDSDDDGFSDGEETLKYESDPNDADSQPEAISSLEQSFEDDLNAAFWSTPEDSDAEWQIDTELSSDGNQSIRSGVITHNQQSGIALNGLFVAGQLSFDAYVSSESCCDKLRVYVDGELQQTISSNGEWRTYTLELSQDEHTIEWRYTKDGSVNTGSDAVWIDAVTFTEN